MRHSEMMIDTLKKYINTFLDSPSKLIWFYIILNMIPSIFLIFTEPINIYGKIILITFPLGLYIILFSLMRNTGLIQLILFPLLIIHAFQLVVFYLFGEDVIAVDMFLNVVTTNPSEAGELLNSLWPSIIFVCILYIPTTVIAIYQMKYKTYLENTLRKKLVVMGGILIIASYILSLLSKDNNTDRYTFHENVYPVNVFYNLNFAINKWHKSRLYPVTSKDFTFEARKDTIAKQREIYTLVIGETSRAENWSLYGYERETTPLLKQKEGLVFFNDAITQSNTTHKSVSIMMSAASAENYNIIYEQKSIIEAFKEVGFTTIFLSNQGANNTFTQYFAEDADYYRNIRSPKDDGKIIDNYDDALLPLLDHCIDSISGNLFIILHTYGSHFNYEERYPKGFSKFKPDNVKEITRKEKEKLVNAYDNTILYTDDFLSRITDILNNSGSCSSMLFASDHGEDILDDDRMRFLHASPNPTFYQLRIPMLVWFSSNYQMNFQQKYEAAKANKLKPVSTNAIFHTLLDIASVKTNYLQSDLSLVNPSFKIAKRMYLGDHDNPVFFYNANLKEEDKIMIEKRKIYH
ncbi:MAG: lipid A phosphoethanolamine transferase [Prevotella sp.]|nr:lipid A phosphoethanolamine transferase [Prevotella sp.]